MFISFVAAAAAAVVVVVVVVVVVAPLNPGVSVCLQHPVGILPQHWLVHTHPGHGHV